MQHFPQIQVSQSLSCFAALCLVKCTKKDDVIHEQPLVWINQLPTSKFILIIRLSLAKTIFLLQRLKGEPDKTSLSEILFS